MSNYLTTKQHLRNVTNIKGGIAPHVWAYYKYLNARLNCENLLCNIIWDKTSLHLQRCSALVQYALLICKGAKAVSHTAELYDFLDSTVHLVKKESVSFVPLPLTVHAAPLFAELKSPPRISPLPFSVLNSYWAHEQAFVELVQGETHTHTVHTCTLEGTWVFSKTHSWTLWSWTKWRQTVDTHTNIWWHSCWSLTRENFWGFSQVLHLCKSCT